MATSADRDDHDKDEHDEADEEHEGGEKDAGERHSDAGSADKKSASAAKDAKSPAKARDDEEEEDDEEDDAEEDEEEKPAPKQAPKSARAGKARGPGAVRAVKAAPAQGGGSLGKSVLLFFVIVIGLGAGFAILGREQPAEVAHPKWMVGDVADVEVTLVKSDRQDLACASSDEVAGKHCAFEAANKPWSKSNDANDDKKLLKPYTTVDRLQFTAAGLWSDPGMNPDRLPATRFSVKCKFKVEGKLNKVGVRWESTGQWFQQDGWYAGTLSGCTLN